MKEQLIFQRLLKKKYEELKFENPQISRREFSKSIGLSAGAISEIFSGRRKVSLKLAKRIAQRIQLDPQTRTELFNAFSKYSTKPARVRSKQQTPADPNYLRLSTDQFRLIEEWYHLGILTLMDTRDFKSEISWIAERLDLSVPTVRTAIDRLIRLGLIRVEENGGFTLSSQCFHTSDDVPDASVRQAHLESLEMARKALNTLPVNERDFTYIMVTLSPEQMPRAKEMIRKFQNDLIAELGTNDQTEVYQLNVQLYPLTQVRKNEKGSNSP